MLKTEVPVLTAAGTRAREPLFPRPLYVVLLLGGLARLLLIAWFHGEPLYVGDERDYNAIAVNLVQRGQFAAEGGQLTSIRPPLYPAAVALVYRLAGVENYTAVRAVQALLGLVTVLVVYRLAEQMYDRRVALAAAIGTCFYPSLLFMGNLVLTEVLFTLLLCLVCLFVQRHLAAGSLGWLLAAGGVLGLAALTRSVLWLFPPLLLVFVWWAGRWRWSRLAGGVAAVAVFCLVLAPWAVRNTRLHRTFTTVDVMGGRNFMMGNYEHTPMFRAWDAISIHGERAWYRTLARENPGFREMTQGQKDKLAMKRGLRFALAHPGLTARRDLVKFLNFWQLERTVAVGLSRGYWGDLPRPAVLAVAALIAGSYAAVMLLGVFGLMLRPPADLRLHVFLLLLGGFICAVHTAVFGHARYHLPLMPLVTIYAAAAVTAAGQLWSRRGTWRFWAAAALCGLLVASWGWELVFVEMARIRQGML